MKSEIQSHTGIRKHMGLLYVFLSGIFLFDPMIGFVDMLPDVIGYLLLCVGLARLSDLNDCLADAAQRFRVMVWVGFGQLAASYIVHIVMNQRADEMNRYEQPVTLLLCSFVLLILQWYFLIPAFRLLFKGMGQLAERHGNDALCAEKKNRTRSEKMSAQTTLWIVLSSLLSLLPELSILTSFEHDAESEIFTFDWYRFINLFRGACGILLAILALVWLVRYLCYVGAGLRDGEWLETIRQRYADEILPQTGMLTLRRFSMAFLLIKVGAVFTVSLRINDLSVLPSLGFAVLIWLAVTHLGKLISEPKPCKTACIGLGAVSAAQVLLNTTYLSRFLPEASLYQADAYWYFLGLRIAGVCEAIVTLVAVGALLKLLMEIVRQHTAVDYGKGSEAVSASATDRLHRGLEKRLRIIFVIFFLAALANAVDAFICLTVPWIWSVALVLSIAGIWLLSSFLHELSVQIQNRYQKTGINE